MSAPAGPTTPTDRDQAAMGPLEQRAVTVLEAPLAGTAAARGYAASSQGCEGQAGQGRTECGVRTHANEGGRRDAQSLAALGWWLDLTPARSATS
jgi:hypothetical protein